MEERTRARCSGVGGAGDIEWSASASRVLYAPRSGGLTGRDGRRRNESKLRVNR
jgi:hypothetical protein